LANHGDLLVKEKRYFIQNKLPEVTENFKSLKTLCVEMQHIFFSGIHAANEHMFVARLAKTNPLHPTSFDYETLGGHVNFASLKSCFQ
jgi:hypothetical protein